MSELPTTRRDNPKETVRERERERERESGIKRGVAMIIYVMFLKYQFNK
jgi:hypothetical protein